MYSKNCSSLVFYIDCLAKIARQFSEIGYHVKKMAVKMSRYFTKQDFLRFKICPRLFAYEWHGYARQESKTSEHAEFLIKQGREVGSLARELFKGPNSFYVSNWDIQSAKELTQKLFLISDTLFEGLFLYKQLVTRPDIYHVKNKSLIEVKSTTGISNEHIYDLAFQVWVLAKNSLKLNEIKICHLNRNYVFNKTLNLAQLFTFTDVKKEVLGVQEEVRVDVDSMMNIANSKQLPKKVIGKCCEANGGCPFKKDCWGETYNKSIFNLRRDISGKKFELHNSGISDLKDIPDFVKLTPFQQLQKEAERLNGPVINQNAISESINGLEFPIYFLDFETFSLAIPPFEGCSPYLQIPFQVSIHEWRTPKSVLRHHSYLHDKDTDPRKSVLEFLLNKLGRVGTIVSYHASFEIGRLYELIKVFPEFESDIISLIDRVWDLEKIFEKGMYVHPDFKGSTSIKKVLPALNPGIGYDDLEVQNGAAASIAYLKMISKETSEFEKHRIYKNLEDYCKKDTFALYAIFKKIQEVL